MLRKNRIFYSVVKFLRTSKLRRCFYCIYFVCVLTCTHHSMYRDQRAACRSQLSPSTPWVPGIELRSSDLAASTFPLNHSVGLWEGFLIKRKKMNILFVSESRILLPVLPMEVQWVSHAQPHQDTREVLLPVAVFLLSQLPTESSEQPLMAESENPRYTLTQQKVKHPSLTLGHLRVFSALPLLKQYASDIVKERSRKATS